MPGVLTLDFWLGQQPRVRFWLRELVTRRYCTGGRLLEGPFLLGADIVYVADMILASLEAEGYVRRGGFAPSASRLGWVGGFGDGPQGEGDVRGLRGRPSRVWKASPRLTDLEWYPTERTPAVAAPERFSCVWCETGPCATAERELKDGVAMGAYHSEFARGEGCWRCDEIYPRKCAWCSLADEPLAVSHDGQLPARDDAVERLDLERGQVAGVHRQPAT